MVQQQPNNQAFLHRIYYIGTILDAHSSRNAEAELSEFAEIFLCRSPQKFAKWILQMMKVGKSISFQTRLFLVSTLICFGGNTRHSHTSRIYLSTYQLIPYKSTVHCHGIGKYISAVDSGQIIGFHPAWISLKQGDFPPFRVKTRATSL